MVSQCKALDKAAPETEIFAATFGALASADGHAALASAELTLPALVSGDAEARAASSEAKKQLQQMWNRAYGVCACLVLGLLSVGAGRADVFSCLRAGAAGAVGAEQVNRAWRAVELSLCAGPIG